MQPVNPIVELVRGDAAVRCEQVGDEAAAGWFAYLGILVELIKLGALLEILLWAKSLVLVPKDSLRGSPPSKALLATTATAPRVTSAARALHSAGILLAGHDDLQPVHLGSRTSCSCDPQSGQCLQQSIWTVQDVD